MQLSSTKLYVILPIEQIKYKFLDEHTLYYHKTLLKIFRKRAQNTVNI